MDSFIAALKVGATGRVVGVDMTDAQLEKATRWRRHTAFGRSTYRKAYIEDTGLPAEAFDCVISNGVINLAADKARVFQEAARLLKRGGRLAIADIVTDVPLPETVVCNADLWAACIGGAAQQQDYRTAIELAGLRVERLEENTAYRFISERAQKATAKWGVKSISLLGEEAVIFRPFYYYDLGCASYLLGCGTVGRCAVVDPRADDVETYVAFARDKKMRITQVIDTHVHADHRSGGVALAKATGAPYRLHETADVRVPFTRHARRRGNRAREHARPGASTRQDTRPRACPWW